MKINTLEVIGLLDSLLSLSAFLSPLFPFSLKSWILPYPRHSAKYFAYIISFKFNISSMRKVLLISSLKKVKMLVAQSCLTLCNPMGYSLPSYSVHGILQARILEWIYSLLQGIFPTQELSMGVLQFAGRFFAIRTTKEARYPHY